MLQQPSVRLRIDDGPNYLLLTDRRYDVVTADIIRPYDPGGEPLLGRVLPPGMVQWLPPYSDYQYRLIMRHVSAGISLRYSLAYG